jgi:DHA2 family multidrug resistance protein
MRNLGASIGIAMVTTLVARSQQANTSILGAHVSAGNAHTHYLLKMMRDMFVSQGTDSATATRRAYAAVFGMVQRQAGMMAFNHTYLLLAALFVLMVPLVALMRRPSSGSDKVVVH